MWGSLDLSGDPTRVRDALLGFFPDLIATYGDTAAVLGADWYDLLRDVPATAKSFQAIAANPLPVEQSQASLRYGLGPLFQTEPDPAAALSSLMRSTQRLVLQPGRDTVWGSAAEDPVRTAVARVPSGPQTCRFCIMLASRGAVYASLVTAGSGNDYHDDCDCVPTVVRSRADLPDGHSIALYRRLYQEGSGYGRVTTQGGVMDTATPVIQPPD